MKKMLVLLASVGLLGVSASASAFSTAPCAACHKIDADLVGPAWKTVAEKYGSEAALAEAFKGGFKVEDRKVAGSIAKWKSQTGTMTPMFNQYIKGHEDDAAKALFAAVKAGKM
jgi:cytochrome c